MRLIEFCKVYPNSASSQLCDEIINWFESADSKTIKADRDTRKDIQKWVDSVDDKELYDKIETIKRQTLNSYLKDFPLVYRGQRKLISEETKVQRTDPRGGGFHNFHAEVSHYKNIRRCLAWTLYLNDIEDNEGETEFLYDKIRVQPKKGMMCIFPASFAWAHRGNPVHSGSKYISTGWWLYPKEGKQD